MIFLLILINVLLTGNAPVFIRGTHFQLTIYTYIKEQGAIDQTE